MKKNGSRHDPFLRKIGIKIGRHLVDREQTPEWLAYKADIARSTLREIIGGRSNPRVLTLRSIAIALDYTSLEDFLRKL